MALTDDEWAGVLSDVLGPVRKPKPRRAKGQVKREPPVMPTKPPTTRRGSVLPECWTQADRRALANAVADEARRPVPPPPRRTP